MTTALKLRRGTTSQHSTFTGAAGEVTVDTTKKTVVVHDGATAGGKPLATESDVALKLNAANPSYTGTLTGGTGVVNLGSGQFYKDASGNVGIGTTPSANLHISKAGGVIVKLGTSLNTSEIEARESGASNLLVFSSNNSVDNLVINSTGTVALTGGNTSANGIGITFPATQSASSDANTLDDYEEGTWTPSLVSTTGTLTTVVNGTGYYTKVGRVVTIVCRPVITTNGTGASALRLSGLPFTALETTMIGGASREDAVVGWVFGISANTGTSLYIAKYDNTYPGGNGHAFPICITYTTS